MLERELACSAAHRQEVGGATWRASPERSCDGRAGDSRAVLCRGATALALSEDHKPSHASERARIMAAGGFLSEIGGITRVNGNLNLSRAIGDLRYKMNHQAGPLLGGEGDLDGSCWQRH